MINILGDRQEKSKYNRDLAEQINEEWKKEARINEIYRAFQPVFYREGITRGKAFRLYRIEKAFLEYLNSDEEEIRKGELPISLVSGLRPIERDDVYDFSKMLMIYPEEPLFKDYAGIFLSALIMESREEHLSLDLKYLSRRKNVFLNSIGYGLEDKKLGVHGYVGDKFANNSKNCYFEVDKVGKEVGHGSEHCMIVIHFGEMEGFFDPDKIGEGTEIIRTAGGFDTIWNQIHPPRCQR